MNVLENNNATGGASFVGSRWCTENKQSGPAVKKQEHKKGKIKLDNKSETGRLKQAGSRQKSEKSIK